MKKLYKHNTSSKFCSERQLLLGREMFISSGYPPRNLKGQHFSQEAWQAPAFAHLRLEIVVTLWMM
jgi:hypothetical protein